MKTYSMRISRAHIVPALAAVLALVMLAACGGTNGASREPAQAEQTQRRITIFLLTDDGTAAIGRRRELAATEDSARGALRLLFAGPTDDEQSSGLTSAFPSSTKLSSFSLQEQSGEAVVQPSEAPLPESAVDRVRMITQVARTLIGVQGIERVRIRFGDKPLGLWTQAGAVIDKAYSYDDLLGFSGICVADGAEAVSTDCFSALP